MAENDLIPEKMTNRFCYFLLSAFQRSKQQNKKQYMISMIIENNRKCSCSDMVQTIELINYNKPS